MEIFHFQAKNCTVLANYLKFLKIKPLSIKKIEDIVFLPISFFKTQIVQSLQQEAKIIFQSSGTGGDRSQHFVLDESNYHNSVSLHFNHAFENHKDYCHLALLPNYLEQGNSSLVNQVKYFIDTSNFKKQSGFFLNNFNDLEEKLIANKEIPTVLWGVTYALLDFIENRKIDQSNLLIMETGGMKGRKKEIIKSEVSELLKIGFPNAKLSSEYGMTELFSQAYWVENEFRTHPTMQVKIRALNDPFQLLGHGKHGAINVIDLHNWQTCSFIETADLGISSPTGFQALGRLDHADIRGCSLMYTAN